MRIGILSDPNNFHTRKWAKALERAGNEVTVFSFENNHASEIHAIRVKPAFSTGDKFTYLSYLASGARLRDALAQENIDLVNALNVTPFGVWGRMSGFHPLVISAMGADIFE